MSFGTNILAKWMQAKGEISGSTEVVTTPPEPPQYEADTSQIKIDEHPKTIPCGYCGTMIHRGRNQTRKYCGPKCRTAAYRERKKKQEKELA